MLAVLATQLSSNDSRVFYMSTYSVDNTATNGGLLMGHFGGKFGGNFGGQFLVHFF